jgi:hypothetical protein
MGSLPAFGILGWEGDAPEENRLAELGVDVNGTGERREIVV